MKSSIIILIFTLFFSGLQAQAPHPILRIFEARITGDEVRLNWIITGGQTCAGIIIQRSVDGQFFETIGEIDGICGSPDVDVPYVFIDDDPAENQQNTYRLELGTQGYSDVRSVEYVPLNDEGFNVRYDMVSKNAVIFLQNDLNDRIDFVLYSITGAKVAEGFTNGNSINLELSAFAGQIFICRIQKKNQIIPVKVPAF
jgi:hypothetical protein